MFLLTLCTRSYFHDISASDFYDSYFALLNVFVVALVCVEDNCSRHDDVFLAQFRFRTASSLASVAGK